jgi:predicted permease
VLSDLLFRLRALFHQRTVEEELDDELRSHFEHEVEKLMNSGLVRREALRRARLALGGFDQVKEECRQARGISWLETVIRDVNYALRGMRRSPTFTITAVITLAVGTGAIATVFTLANTLFLRKLPVDRPDEVVVVQATRRHGQMPGWVSYPDYVHFRDQTKTLQCLAAHYSTAPLFVTANNQSREVNGAVVSENFFPMLGIKPTLGRFFSQDEDSVPDRDRVAVISYEFWRNWLGAAPEAPGSTLKINGSTFTVIGVAPQAFRGVLVAPDEIYIPTMMARSGYRWCEDALATSCTIFDMIGRLREGSTVEEARAEMVTLLPQSWTTAKEGQNTGITVFQAKGVQHPDLTRSSQLRFIEVLFCAAGVLLLVCCVNLAGLLIARNSARTREFAIRASLGAGTGRLARQLITESVLLAAVGGGLGMIFSLALTAGLNSMFYSLDDEGHPLYYNFTPAPVVIVVVILISIGTGLLVGLVPALGSIRTDPAESLKLQSSAVTTGRRLGQWLAGAQHGVAVALVAVAGLLTTSAQGLIVGTNFEASHVALMRLRPRLLKYSPERAQRFLRTAIKRLEEVPGVESASMVGTGVVLLGSGATVSLPGASDDEVFKCGYLEIGSRYFETLRAGVLAGREFDAGDTIHAPPVAVVSAALASRLWAAGTAIGEILIVNGRPRQVVGVVKDVPLQSRAAPVTPYVYIPFWQNPAQVDARLALRVKGDPSAMLPALTREVNRVDPDVPIAETITLPLQIAGSIRSERITASFISYAAILAVLLSGIGLYGATAFSVSRRAREVGIRMALGAKSADVLAMIIREGMTVVFIGVVIGVGLAIAAARLIQHLLYGSSAADALIYALAVLVVAFAGLFACWVSARRAARVDPSIALRQE